MKVNLESTNQPNTSRCYREKVCVGGQLDLETTDPDVFS